MTQSIPAPATPATAPALHDILTRLHVQLEERLCLFRDGPVTPAAFHALEQALQGTFDAAARDIVEQELNSLEPQDKEQTAPKVRYHKETYRRNKRTPAQIATTFGPITLWS